MLVILYPTFGEIIVQLLLCIFSAVIPYYNQQLILLFDLGYFSCPPIHNVHSLTGILVFHPIVPAVFLMAISENQRMIITIN